MSLLGSVWPDAHTTLRMPSTPRRESATDEQLRHVFAATLMSAGFFRAEDVARLFGVTRMTVFRWKRLALTYDIPEAEGLRRLTGR